MSDNLCSCSPDCTIPYGYCHCGCGEKTKINTANSFTRGWIKGEPRLYLKGHNDRPELNLPDPNPSGYCKCGCGRKTPIAKYTAQRDGFVRGCHTEYIKGHRRRLTPEQRLSRYKIIDMGYSTPCWVWQGSLNAAGYGTVGENGSSKLAHRLNYEYYFGSIEDDLPLDHLCYVTACINPNHLEAVVHAVNSQRRQNSVANWEVVREIRKLCSEGYTAKVLAKRFNMSEGNVYSIKYHKTWKE